MIRQQKGFAAVEAVLIVVILVIIGGTGWYVLHSRQATDKTLADANKSTSAQTKKSTVKSFEECKKLATSKILETYPEQCVTSDGKKFVDSISTSSDWTQYTAPDKSYRIKIPDGWYIRRTPTAGTLDTYANKLAIKTGQEAKFYELDDGGKDHDSGLVIDFESSNNGGKDDFRNSVKGSTKQASLRTDTGLEIEKYYYYVAKDPGIEDKGLSKGGKSYVYAIFTKSGYVDCFYGINSGQTDYHVNVEAALKTVQIP